MMQAVTAAILAAFAGYAGAWYGVNPFDQPGVELGKQLTFAAMGRPGFGGPVVGEPASADEA